MKEEKLKTYQVYKGLQRSLIFKGLKGIYIYIAFALAGTSLIASVIGGLAGGFMVGGAAMLIILFGGLFGLTLYQRKNGLYQKRKDNKIFIVKNIFSHGIN